MNEFNDIIDLEKLLKSIQISEMRIFLINTYDNIRDFEGNDYDKIRRFIKISYDLLFGKNIENIKIPKYMKNNNSKKICLSVISKLLSIFNDVNNSTDEEKFNEYDFMMRLIKCIYT